MDPITVIIIAMLTALIGGATGASLVALRRKNQRKLLGDIMRTEIPCLPDPAISIFDIFWDLGANEFSLELMAHRGLLIAAPDDFEALSRSLPERVAEHGSYRSFVDDNLEAIEEYHQNSNKPGGRRRLFPLANPKHKLLSDGSAKVKKAIVPYDRSAARMKDGGVPLLQGNITEAMDVDQVLNTDTLGILQELFSGQGAKKLLQWFELRNARKLRAELDDTLSDLYQVYSKALLSQPDFIAHLDVAAGYWDSESSRLRMLIRRRTWKNQEWSLSADELMSQALLLAKDLAKTIKKNVSESVRRIDHLAKNNELPMAGYLLYINRHAFFARNSALTDAPVRAIELATHRLQQELRESR